MERLAVPDPRQNVTGKHVDANKRLDNMDIQIAPFNYPAIAGVIGILVAIALVIFITKGRG